VDIKFIQTMQHDLQATLAAVGDAGVPIIFEATHGGVR
jgi:hypothetical protein